MCGDIKLDVGSDLARSLGCHDLTTGMTFTLLLGTNTNELSYSLPKSTTTSGSACQDKNWWSFLILISQLPICNFGQNVMLCSQPIDMDLHLIKNVMSPVNKFDAVNKTYVGRIKYKTATGIIPNTVATDHRLLTFLVSKAFASENVWICEMWVERVADEWIST